jgi:hypothetical protein
VLASAAGPAVAAGAAPSDRGSRDPAVRIAALDALARGADAQLAVSERNLADLRNRLGALEAAEAAAHARTDELGLALAAAQARSARARTALAELAAAAYRDGANVSQLGVLLRARSPLDAAYRRGLVRRSAEVRQAAVVEARAASRALSRARQRAAAERARIRADLATVRTQTPAVERRVATARARGLAARFWSARWRSVAGGTATPIRGQPVLGSEEMARWFRATRGDRSRATVPIPELAGYYVEEGSAENVRSDVAFAQSILETAGFRFPDGGQVAPADNNFAGMGACDSCATGLRFPDARTGVRAQLQQLRVYAQPGLRNSMLAHPAVDPRLDTHFLRGRVPTWGGLTHTWATADGYGDRILAIYCEMLAWLTDRAELG